MELLSPAGNLESAYSAFKGGADAIYLGGKQFSARASADNFSDDQIKEITFFAHSIGKKVYVTLNTLLFQDEFFDAVDFAKFLYSINIDGVIIQDLGLAHYLHQTLPGLPLNASTQLNCHNVRQAEALIKIGFKRIVLAREANLDTIKAIKNLGVEVEVFGHGALCVSYSGNCLLSSFIGDRSGNRGRCAQPCRMRYDLLEDGECISHDSFAISTKDLMTLDYLDKFLEVGVDSLKIEGRLKSNEYIYSVSKAYRHAIDAAEQLISNKSSSKDKEILKKIFNRQFTKGFVLNESPFRVINSASSSHQGELVGKVIKVHKKRVSIKLTNALNRLDGIRFNGKEQIGLTIERMFINGNPVESAKSGDIIEIANVDDAEKVNNLDVIKTKDNKLVKTIESELKESIKVKISGLFFAKPNSKLMLSVTLNSTTVNVEGDIALEAEGSGTTLDRIKEQLNKTGNYPYQFESLEIKMDKCFIPISSLNSLRSKALEALANKLIKTNNVNEKEYKTISICSKKTANISFFVDKPTYKNQLVDSGYFVFSNNDETCRNNERITASIIFNRPKEVVHFVIENKDDNYLIASQYCSITNSYALDCFYSLGFKECILSSELDYDSIKALINDYESRNKATPNVGLVIYGKLDMMIMRSCPIGTYYGNDQLHCGKCHKNYYELVDRMGEKYHIVGDANCNIRVLNNHPIWLFDQLDEIESIGVSNLWLILSDETKEKVDATITNFENKGKFDRRNFTRGHFLKRPL